jgi:hypothetical protein
LNVFILISDPWIINPFRGFVTPFNLSIADLSVIKKQIPNHNDRFALDTPPFGLFGSAFEMV